MKKVIIILAGTIFFSTSSQAIECPKYTLKCDHKILNTIGYYETVESVKTQFIGINDDEPSLPANECEARVSFSLNNPDLSFNITIKEDLTAYLYLFSAANHGVTGPQFQTEAVTTKSISISSKNELMTCALE